MKNETLDKAKLIENNLVDGRLDQVTLVDIELTKNDFSRMEIIGSSMKDVDISSCKVDELSIAPEMVKGMIVNEVQAIELISILGVIIK